MLVQVRELAKGAVAEVALVGCGVGVPSPGSGLERVGAGPADELLGDEAGGVLLADEAVNGIAVEVLGLGAGAVLNVVDEAGGGGEAAFAEGADDGGVEVDGRAEVLLDIV